jgi:hypothetical protein
VYPIGFSDALRCRKGGTPPPPFKALHQRKKRDSQLREKGCRREGMQTCLKWWAMRCALQQAAAKTGCRPRAHGGMSIRDKVPAHVDKTPEPMSRNLARSSSFLKTETTHTPLRSRA